MASNYFSFHRHLKFQQSIVSHVEAAHWLHGSYTEQSEFETWPQRFCCVPGQGTMPLSTQVYKWVLANLILWGGLCD